MRQVFISHSSMDRAFVEEELVPLLKHHSIGTWYSASAIKTAALWEREIRLGLVASDWFLVVLSPHAGQSDWVKAEVQWAIENRRDRLIPVMIADCDPGETHLLLARYQFVDFRSDVVRARSGLLSLWDQELQVEQTLKVALEWREEAAWSTGSNNCDAALVVRNVLIVGGATIGRDPTSEIRLTDFSVSQRHAELKVRGNQGVKALWLVDLASTNGVYLNGVRIGMPAIVGPGDRIGIGEVEITVGRIAE